MKTILFSTLLIFSATCFSQTREIDSLRKEIFTGNISALKALAKYLNSSKVVKEHLGYHVLTTREKDIAARYISESLFFDHLKKDSLTTEEFAQFISSNRLTFNENIGYFILENSNPDTTQYRLYKTDQALANSIKEEFKKALPAVMTESGADWSYKLKNPQSLLILAEYFLNQRSKWNIYHFNDADFIKSFRYLTHMDFAVPDIDSSINFTYYLTSEVKRKNLYSYFFYHYKDYKWNDSMGYFINTREYPLKKDELISLFELLKSENDSIALSAFTQIAESDPDKVVLLSKQFSIAEHDDNFSLPTFTYRFLPIMAELASYFRSNKISYNPTAEIKTILESLLKENEFKTRYELENLLINKASIGDISAIEYFGLINEKDFQCTYSIGRVLDKWYSKNWNAVITNNENLEIYLKKASAFDNLGIIGICNKYLRKFENTSSSVLDKVKAILDSTTDAEIITAAKKILEINKLPEKKILPPIKEWSGEKKYYTNRPELEALKIINSRIPNDDKEDQIEKLTGKVSFEQIGGLLKQLLKDTSLDSYSKYNFLESDFGIHLNDKEAITIDSFLKKYNVLSHKDLYLTNLSAIGIHIQKYPTGYDYEKIYDILKYDVVDAFVGGGGGRRDNNVYQVIKLLELQFETTLGFTNKLCSWQGIWGCDCTDRAKYWMNYLLEKKLVSPPTAEPVSISCNN